MNSIDAVSYSLDKHLAEETRYEHWLESERENHESMFLDEGFEKSDIDGDEWDRFIIRQWLLKD